MLITRASSINRALDQIGDKWCWLIIQEVFWGVNSFNEMATMIGISKGILSDRLKWLQSVACLRKDEEAARPRYRLTKKSAELYQTALAGVAWEREFYDNPRLDQVNLTHIKCGKAFQPQMVCHCCHEEIKAMEVKYVDGSGSCEDERQVKVRRRSSVSVPGAPGNHNVYKNLVHLVGDRWTANVIALAFHRIKRFDDFHKELPVATNILAARLKFLVKEEIFDLVEYQQKPPRSEYHLTPKGLALYPFFLTLLQWGDKWCDDKNTGPPMLLSHTLCDESLHGDVICSECGDELLAHEVVFSLPGPQ